MEREKGVVCEEISMNEDSPEDLCLDLLANAYYGKENYGRNILGTTNNVKGFTVSDIARYKKARYCPENIVISFAGNIDFQTAQALVKAISVRWIKVRLRKESKRLSPAINRL